MDKELLDFGQYLESMLSETQIRILAICLTNSIPVCFYGIGLGKSTLVEILRNANFEEVYAPEDCDSCSDQLSVLDKPGAIALCMKKDLSTDHYRKILFQKVSFMQFSRAF